MGIVKDTLKQIRKSEKKHLKMMIIPHSGIIIIGIILSSLGFYFSGISIIIIGIVLYLKIYQLSITHIKQWENFARIEESDEIKNLKL